jgi:hypothetical protein
MPLKNFIEKIKLTTMNMKVTVTELEFACKET